MQSKNDAQQMKLTHTAGAAVDTDITVTGIRSGDVIQSIVDITNGANVDPSTFVITDDDDIQSPTVATDTASAMLVMWIDRSAG